MSDKKEKTITWKNWMSIIIILAMIIIVLLFNNQSSSLYPGQNKNVSIENNANVNGSDTNIINNSTKVTSDNDTYFKNWVTVSVKTMTENLNCISKAGKNRNFTDMERCGKFLSENSNNSLRSIDEYNVSPPMQITLEEYKKALQNYNIGGVKLETGARNRNVSQMGDAIIYIERGATDVDNIIVILYPNSTLDTKTVKKDNQEIN